MNKGKIFTLIIAGVSAFTALAAPKPTLLSIKETITDNSIVYPESFETDTKEMMQNWYIKNYTVLDADVEKRSSNDATDAEYIKRLKALPTAIEMPYNQVVRSYIDMHVKRRRTARNRVGSQPRCRVARRCRRVVAVYDWHRKRSRAGGKFARR